MAGGKRFSEMQIKTAVVMTSGFPSPPSVQDGSQHPASGIFRPVSAIAGKETAPARGACWGGCWGLIVPNATCTMDYDSTCLFTLGAAFWSNPFG
jgi:hypothetical protein